MNKTDTDNVSLLKNQIRKVKQEEQDALTEAVRQINLNFNTQLNQVRQRLDRLEEIVGPGGGGENVDGQTNEV